MREDPDKIMYIMDDTNCIYNNDCMVMDRKFIGIKQSTKYCDMALKRLGE